MSGTGTHEGPNKRTPVAGRDRPSRNTSCTDAWARATHDLERRIAADYEATFDRPPQTKQLRNMVGFWRLVEAGIRSVDGTAFLRSTPQMARGVARHSGWKVDFGAKELHQRYRTNLHNVAGYFIAMGWLDGWEPQLEVNGEGRGILLRVPAGVAQSVRAAES